MLSIYSSYRPPTPLGSQTPHCVNQTAHMRRKTAGPEVPTFCVSVVTFTTQTPVMGCMSLSFDVV